MSHLYPRNYCIALHFDPNKVPVFIKGRIMVLINFILEKQKKQREEDTST